MLETALVKTQRKHIAKYLSLIRKTYLVDFAVVSVVGGVVGVSPSGGGPSVSGFRQSPETWTPMTLMQGRWKDGSLGNFSQEKVTPIQMPIGAQLTQGTIKGSKVGEPSLAVAAAHPFVVCGTSARD